MRNVWQTEDGEVFDDQKSAAQWETAYKIVDLLTWDAITKCNSSELIKIINKHLPEIRNIIMKNFPSGVEK